MRSKSALARDPCAQSTMRSVCSTGAGDADGCCWLIACCRAQSSGRFMLAATVSMSSSESDPSAAEWAVRKRSTMARARSSLKEERRWAVRDEKKSPLGALAVAALADEAAADELLAAGGGDDFAAAEAATAAGGERTTEIAAGTGEAAAGEALPSAPSTAATAQPRRYWLLRATGYWLTSRSNSLRSIASR